MQQDIIHIGEFTLLKKVLWTVLASAVVMGIAACGSDDASDSDFIGDKLDYKIVGIDPGAGIMDLTINTVLPEYGLDDDWTVETSSGTAMAAELKKAIDKKEPIIVTGWIPHWKFSRYDLKMLDDPKGAFKGEKDINTLVRLGLKDDHPGAYKFFDQFKWEPDDLQDVMLKIEKGQKEQEAAKEWVEDHKDLVDKWTKGVKSGKGEKLKMTYVAWDDVIASSNVVKYVLEHELDYEVELLQVEAGPMFAGVADGSADAMVGAWMPTTHKAYYDKYKGKFEDLGVNLTGTRNGLAVPAYMDIDSIEDLKKDK